MSNETKEFIHMMSIYFFFAVAVASAIFGFSENSTANKPLCISIFIVSSIAFLVVVDKFQNKE